jgi:hypothetical protein
VSYSLLFGCDQVLHAGVQEAASALGRKERGPAQDQHPVCHSLYCIGMTTSGPVHSLELFCEVWPREEGSDVTEFDGSGEDDVTR